MRHLLAPAVLLSLCLGFVAAYGDEFPLPMPGPGPSWMVIEPFDPPKADAKAESPRVGPVACAVVRAKLRAEYAKQGMGVVERWKKAAEATDEVINLALPDAEKIAGQKVVGQLGDGTILQKILDFLSSPQGQAIIEILLKLLMGLAEPQPTAWIPSMTFGATCYSVGCPQSSVAV